MNAASTIVIATPNVPSSGLPVSDTGHEIHGDQQCFAGVQPLTDGQGRPDAHAAAAVGHALATDHADVDRQSDFVGGDHSADGQRHIDAQCPSAVGNPLGSTIAPATPSHVPSSRPPSSPTNREANSNVPASGWAPSADGQDGCDTHTPLAVGNSSSSPTMHDAATKPTPSGWLNLRVWAEMYHDAQTHRIAASNRAERGGVHPDEYQPHIDALKALEHQCGLVLVRAYRRIVPVEIREWQKASPGIGEHSLARLLGHLGHPVHATPHVWIGGGASRELKALEPFDRGVAQLWAYCGHGDPARRKRRGMSVDDAFGLGSPTCKMIVHQLLAVACVKQPKGTIYRDAYDEARARYADRVDDEGKAWTLLHQHNAALRFVGKQILKDLWIAGRAS